jgi:hypothetical protein
LYSTYVCTPQSNASKYMSHHIISDKSTWKNTLITHETFEGDISLHIAHYSVHPPINVLINVSTNVCLPQKKISGSLFMHIASSFYIYLFLTITLPAREHSIIGFSRCFSIVFLSTTHLQNFLVFFRGWQSMFAYGCHNFVVVVDPETVQVLHENAILNKSTHVYNSHPTL